MCQSTANSQDMLAFKAFGAPVVERNGVVVSGPAVQRRRLALLALLSGLGERGLTRDKLIGYLWPEHTAERARRLLSEALYVLRKELGEEVLGTAEDRIWLRPEMLWTDVGAFERAVEGGRLEEAAALYTAPFLDGFSVADAPEFERWAEAERERLARAYAATLEVLAEECEAAGDRVRAAEWWHRLAVHDPFCSRIALRLMQALDVAGDRMAAVRHGQMHEALLREDLDAEPDPEVIALAERLRRDPAPPGSRPGAQLRIPPPARVPDPVLPNDAPSPAPRESRPQPGRPPPSPLRLAVPLLVILLLGLVGVWQLGVDNAAPISASSANRVVVLPFAVRGTEEVAYLGDAMVGLLSTDLDGAGDLRSANPHTVLSLAARDTGAALDAERAVRIAERLDAGMYVLGDVVEAAGRLRIRAALYQRQGGRAPLAEATVEGDADSLFALVDGLTRELVAEQLDGPINRLTSLAARTTTSLPALKAYLEGERLFRAGFHQLAVEALQRAVAADTAFALAYYRLSIAADWASNYVLSRQAAEQAVRHKERLSESDRLRLEGMLAWRRGAGNEAERLYRTVLFRHPDDIDSWVQLGEVLFHLNPVRGRSLVESRAAWERVLHFQPDNLSALRHLIYVAASEEKHPELDALVERVRALAPHDTLGMSTLRAFALGDRAAQHRLIERLRASSSTPLAYVVSKVALHTRDLSGARGLARLLIAAPPSGEVHGDPYHLLGWLELASGRWRAAQAALEEGDREAPSWLEVQALVRLLPFGPVRRTELETLRDTLRQWDLEAAEERGRDTDLYNDLHPQIRAYLVGSLSIRLGDDAAAVRSADELERMGGSPDASALARFYAASVWAQLHHRHGRTTDALRTLEEHPLEVWLELLGNPLTSQAYERYLRAELLADLGREEEALRWYATLPENSAYDLVYMAPAHLRQGEIHERWGERTKAIEHYTRFVELWKDCDPELRGMVVEAERKLARLRSGG